MTRIFDDDGAAIAVTVLSLDGCQVIDHRTIEKDGYVAIRLGVGTAKPKNTTKPLRGVFAKAEVEPKRCIREFKVSEENLIPPGALMRADHFQVGQLVDVQGVTIGKGFAGAMKRWNFKGLRASHGVSVSHRSHGSTGQRQDPGRTFPGKKMAGQLGHEKVTIQRLTIIRVDVKRGLILVKGAVPGPKGEVVRVSDAVKAVQPIDIPLPGAFFLSNRSALPWSVVEASAPSGTSDYVERMQHAWRGIQDDPSKAQARARSAYELYRAVWSLLEQEKVSLDASQSPLGVLIKNLPAVALELVADDDRDVARAGALLMAILRTGAQPSAWLDPKVEEWPNDLVKFVRAAVSDAIQEAGVRFFIRHHLHRNTIGDETVVSGTVDILGQLPNLELNGPVNTCVPDWGKEAALSLTANWTRSGEPLPAKLRFKVRQVPEHERRLGVMASATVYVSATGADGGGVLRLRPSLARRPLDATNAQVARLPVDSSIQQLAAH